MSDQNIKIWEKIFSTRDWGRYPEPPLIRFVAKNFFRIRAERPIKILELGPGTGSNLWFLAREGLQVYGIDGSQTAIHKAKKYLMNEDLETYIGKLVVSDYSIIDFEDNFFDAIIDVESLSCNSFNKTSEVLTNCYCKLKVGGVLFSQTFAEGCWGMEHEIPERDYHRKEPQEGPLSGIGLVRYCTEKDIYKLYETETSRIENLEIYSRTFMNEKTISEYVVETKRF